MALFGLLGGKKTSVGLDIGSGIIKLAVIDHSGSEPELVKVATTEVAADAIVEGEVMDPGLDRKSTRLNSNHSQISYAVFCLKKKKSIRPARPLRSASSWSSRSPTSDTSRAVTARPAAPSASTVPEAPQASSSAAPSGTRASTARVGSPRGDRHWRGAGLEAAAPLHGHGGPGGGGRGGGARARRRGPLGAPRGGRGSDPVLALSRTRPPPGLPVRAAGRRGR